MGFNTKDINVTSTTTNAKDIVLLDKEYLSYLQQEDLINAIKELTFAIKSRSK